MSFVLNSFNLLEHNISNVLIFFAVEMRGAFALLKLLTFFQQKVKKKINILLTKDVISFDQLGPGFNSSRAERKKNNSQTHHHFQLLVLQSQDSSLSHFL